MGVSQMARLSVIGAVALWGVWPGLSHAQTRPAGTAVLIRGGELDCALSLDGEDLGTLRRDSVRRVTLPKGDHFVECRAHGVVALSSFISFLVKAEGQQVVQFGRLVARHEDVLREVAAGRLSAQVGSRATQAGMDDQCRYLERTQIPAQTAVRIATPLTKRCESWISVLAEYAGARTWQPLFYFDFYDQHGQQIFLDRF